MVFHAEPDGERQKAQEEAVVSLLLLSSTLIFAAANMVSMCRSWSFSGRLRKNSIIAFYVALRTRGISCQNSPKDVQMAVQQGRSERRGENDAGGLFQHPARAHGAGDAHGNTARPSDSTLWLAILIA